MILGDVIETDTMRATEPRILLTAGEGQGRNGTMTRNKNIRVSGIALQLESEGRMRSIAEDRAGGVLASAEIGRSSFGCFKPDRRMVGDLVAAVAERLVGAETAGAPEVALAGFQFHGVRASLSNFRFGHERFSSTVDIGIIAESAAGHRIENEQSAFDGVGKNLNGKVTPDKAVPELGA
jgi:hypothetical protein